MADHIASMLDIRQRILEQLPDLHLARAMVLSLPKTQSSETVSTKLQAEANRRTRDKSGGESALIAQKSKKSGRGNARGGKGKPSPDDECRYCKGKGHWANKCKKCEEDEKRKGEGDSANVAVSGLRDLGTCEIGRVFMASSSKINTSDVFLDTGATSHMFRDRAFFKQYTQAKSHDDAETISVGDQKNVPVVGRGTLTLKCQLPEGVRTVVLHGALHVPRLGMNLVSLGTLQRKGATFRSTAQGLAIDMEGEELLRATLSGTLSASGSLRLWHRRLGHLHIQSKSYDHVCEGCVLGKSHRLPFPKASTTTYEKLELVVVDLTGPMSVETWTGMSYTLVAVEASCRFGVGELLKSKDEVGEALKGIVARLEHQANCKLLSAQWDYP